MIVRRTVARVVLRVARWKVVGEVPPFGITVGAPHTSYWDWVVMLLVMWHGGGKPKVLIKKEIFVGPLGWLLRATGGVPVDRDQPSALIRTLMKQAKSGEPYLLVIAAEGTRSKTDYWKPGFYRIARASRMPIVLGFVDGPTRTMGFGPSVMPTGDVVADMDVLRAFYADKHGIHPDQRTEPRLPEEDKPQRRPRPVTEN
ncbi:1-acyl-sn-glycerol-3-phosphate acyltransferase [Angustibacter sp. McL0619]|uniref:1-acyl-sn-glycerol-3-phosphate acyltransferase n=1 Tax=Angustibacter sp. McL0619 TaxID=3415676 RepID=UPI003CF64DA2